MLATGRIVRGSSGRAELLTTRRPTTTCILTATTTSVQSNLAEGRIAVAPHLSNCIHIRTHPGLIPGETPLKLPFNVAGDLDPYIFCQMASRPVHPFCTTHPVPVQTLWQYTPLLRITESSPLHFVCKFKTYSRDSSE